jgi:hypothetical protein
MDFLDQLNKKIEQPIPPENVCDFTGELEVRFRKELSQWRYSIFSKKNNKHVQRFPTKKEAMRVLEIALEQNKI